MSGGIGDGGGHQRRDGAAQAAEAQQLGAFPDQILFGHADLVGQYLDHGIGGFLDGDILGIPAIFFPVGYPELGVSRGILVGSPVEYLIIQAGGQQTHVIQDLVHMALDPGTGPGENRDGIQRGGNENALSAPVEFTGMEIEKINIFVEGVRVID